MPCYPALALLLGCAMAAEGSWIRRGSRVLSIVAACVALITLSLFIYSRRFPTPGDISQALSHHPGAYTLSLGHMQDLTLLSFAYLRLPLLMAAIAFSFGAIAVWIWKGRRAFVPAALMMILFFHAARVAMAAFDPYLSSRPLAEEILKSPPGTLIIDHHYYTFSSIFFYTGQTALLRNGRFNNLEYGAAAPDAPNVFINDAQFKDLWLSPQRCYIVANENVVPALESLVGAEHLTLIMSSGGKALLSNYPIEIQAKGSSESTSSEPYDVSIRFRELIPGSATFLKFRHATYNEEAA